MAETKTLDFESRIIEVVKSTIQAEVSQEFDKMIEDLNKRKNQIVAGILLNVIQTVDIQRIEDRVIFTIKEIRK